MPFFYVCQSIIVSFPPSYGTKEDYDVFSLDASKI